MLENIYDSTHMANTPGEILRTMLEFVGLSQAEVARRVGRPTSRINDVLQGRYIPTNRTLTPIIAVLNDEARRKGLAVELKNDDLFRHSTLTLEILGDVDQLRRWRKEMSSTGHSALSLIPKEAYNSPSPKKTASAEHGGQGGGNDDPLSRAALSARAAAQWQPPRDQHQFGRDLIRTSVFLGELGRALASGQVAIVSVTPPGRSTRNTRPGRRVSRVPQAKKSGNG